MAKTQPDSLYIPSKAEQHAYAIRRKTRAQTALIWLDGIRGKSQTLAGNALLEIVHALIVTSGERACISVVFSGFWCCSHPRYR